LLTKINDIAGLKIFMAGIYIHIPFCKKACFYCDFHFSVSFKKKKEIVGALIQEVISRTDFFKPKEIIRTIYFGGGTPSVLSLEELDDIMAAIHSHYTVAQDAEITFECNPDDLNFSFLQGLKFAGINRLSVGVQSFDDDHLSWMNRSHNAHQSIQCIHDAAQVGFNDITIDLIYGLPQLSNSVWESTVKKAFELPINHLSAYSLTLEENTPYSKLVKQKKYLKPLDDGSSEHYTILVELSQSLGWDHYEVSSFCKKENYARHNKSYWEGIKYLGIGPSAHSYDQEKRYWNVSSNDSYLDLSRQNGDYRDFEVLTISDQINEKLLTGLRTKWGVNQQSFKLKYGYDIYTLFEKEINYWVSIQWMVKKKENIRLTEVGFLFADYIASSMFVDV
jgi:oxygen-independent coproporphyrinogen III oxidase